MATPAECVHLLLDLPELQGLKGPEASARLATAAREARAEVEADQGVYPTTLFVDGRQSGSEDQVRPGGTIEYHFQVVGDVVDAVYRLLVEASPVGPAKAGHYRDDHWLYVNGRRRDASAEGARIELVPGDEVVFLNSRPYARKIEGGFRRIHPDPAVSDYKRRRYGKKVRRAGQSVQAPGGVYELVVREARRRFHNWPVDIIFAYRAAAPDGATLATGKRRAERYPAILIRVL
ncbi:MAG: hypothetical protein GC191_09490 [Azospirillum sp.]|nr:hypothetical protein [Azospirillum sp.]